MQLLLRGKAEAVHGVGPAVGPLAKLLRRPGEGHAGRHRAVDDCLDGATRTNIVDRECWSQINTAADLFKPGGLEPIPQRPVRLQVFGPSNQAPTV